jgi:glyoxylase-like metal-dependent hydrolase (beta-lactamase superfamily II)
MSLTPRGAPQAVFSGDCVLGSGTAVFADLGDYLRSLQRLLDAKPRRIYPGHGPVVDDAGDRLRMYIRHRAEREAQILAALRAAGAAAMAPEDVVKVRRCTRALTRPRPALTTAPRARSPTRSPCTPRNRQCTRTLTPRCLAERSET